jgi:type VI secretion system protein ImpC
MASRVGFDFSFGKRFARGARAEGERLRILVIADLRGAARAVAARPLASARVQDFSVDNFAQRFAALAPAVDLSARGAEDGVRLAFGALADFHPDALYDSLDLMRELRASRARLTDPHSFADERARLLADRPTESRPRVEQPAAMAPGRAAAPAAGDESAASTLGRLLGGNVAKPSAPSPAASAIDGLLQAIVAPHVKAALPEQMQLIASVDAAISSELRAVLHDPAFQRLEASWRGLDWLVRENALGDELTISVLDASRDELCADLRACAGELERSTVYRLVVEGEVSAPSGRPFSLIISDLYVDGAESDVSLLAGLGALAAQAGGSFIAGARTSLIGCQDLQEQTHWSSWHKPDPAVSERMALLRQSPVAPFLGLALPRLLGRLPYGKQSDPIERFDFSELMADAAHEQYLWLNPSFGCAQLMVASFAADGWDFSLGSELELRDLPLATQLGSDGERIKPCAEVCFDASSAERVLSYGVMPLLSYRDRNAARLLRFQSLAEPAAPLAGPWRA